MTNYKYIEYKQPKKNKNVDLDFTNDLIYDSLVGDELDKYKTPYIIGDIKPMDSKPIINPKTQKNKSVFFVFILCVIVIMLLWYFFGTSAHIEQNQLDLVNNNTDLIALSPDFGFGNSRFGRKN